MWPPSALFEHAGDERAQPVNHAPEIDAQHPVPVIERELPDPGPLDHASVVAQYVNRAMGIESGRGQVVDGVDIRDIGHHTGRVMPGGAKLSHRRVQRIRFDVGQHHLHLSPGEPVGHRQAETARRAGDHRHPTLQVLHISSLPSYSSRMWSGQ